MKFFHFKDALSDTEKPILINMDHVTSIEKAANDTCVIVTLRDPPYRVTCSLDRVEAMLNDLPPLEKPSWRERAATIAKGIEADIQAYAQRTSRRYYPQRATSGDGLSHALFMAQALQGIGTSEVDFDTKACRWLGYLQALVVVYGIAPLADQKEANLASGRAS